MTRSFRLVCHGPHVPLVEELLACQGFVFEPEPFHPLCRRLVHEPFPLGASLAAVFGLIYIQDRSSMLPPLALAPPSGAAVLDMCASPGGKTSFVAQLAGPGGFVLGNEPGGDRLATLRQNLARMNLPQAVTCGYKGQDLPLPGGGFGHILLDPPCSGWGTARKNPQVLSLWTEDKALPLVALQRHLLAKAADLLAPGGRLLYSTCTTNRAENEEQALWAVDELGLELLPLAPFQGFHFHEPLLPAAAGTLRVDEGASDAQGFYLALLAKPGGAPDPASLPLDPAQGATRALARSLDAAATGTLHALPGLSPSCTHDAAPSDPLRPGSVGRGGTRRDDLALARSARGAKPRQLDRPAASRRAPQARAAGDRDPRRSAPELAWDNLPPGVFELFKDELCLLPARGLPLMPVRRKGQRLGTVSGGVFRPWARMRLLAPDPGTGPELDAQEPDVILSLLEGRGVTATAKHGRMTLYFRGLPLGFLTVKGQRALWSDR